MAMVNLTLDEEENLFLTINSVVYGVLFLVTLLPTLVLTVLCIAALLLEKSLDKKIRVVLINIFAAELCVWASDSILYLGYMGRFYSQDDYSCRFTSCFFIISTLQRYTSIALYGLVAYLLIRDSVHALRWQVIVLYIACSWIVAIFLGAIPFFRTFASYNEDAIPPCYSSVMALNSVPFYITSIEVFVCLCFIVIFGTLAYCYTRKIYTDDAENVKKSISRVLLFLLGVSAVSFASLVVPGVYPSVTTWDGDGGVATSFYPRPMIVHCVVRFVLNVVSLLIPVVSIVVMRPLRLAMRDLLEKVFCCSCCRGCSSCEPRGENSAKENSVKENSTKEMRSVVA